MRQNGVDRAVPAEHSCLCHTQRERIRRQDGKVQEFEDSLEIVSERVPPQPMLLHEFFPRLLVLRSLRPLDKGKFEFQYRRRSKTVDYQRQDEEIEIITVLYLRFFLKSEETSWNPSVPVSGNV